MAGELAGFNPDLFRTNITNTMVMGLPVPDDLKPTFYFRSVSTYPDGTILDTSGKPIDPRIAPTTTPAKQPVQVPCAVEFAPDITDNENLGGTFWTNRATVTVLDTQWGQIEGAIEVDLSGRRYLIQQVFTVGLGLVTVYQLQCFVKGTD
jgi:hypothetical protein